MYSLFNYLFSDTAAQHDARIQYWAATTVHHTSTVLYFTYSTAVQYYDYTEFVLYEQDTVQKKFRIGTITCVCFVVPAVQCVYI